VKIRFQQEILALITLTAVNSEANGYDRANVTNANSPDRVDLSQLRNIPKGENILPAPIDGSVDKWFFISGAAV
jgi:hypothetical protein